MAAVPLRPRTRGSAGVAAAAATGSVSVTELSGVSPPPSSAAGSRRCRGRNPRQCQGSAGPEDVRCFCAPPAAPRLSIHSSARVGKESVDP